MSFNDLLKKSVMDGFQNSDISTTKIFVTLVITIILSIYIFFIYRYVAQRLFYDRYFNISMSIISVITAGIILAMQTSLVISLGMVGALSIVRFRTAIKEPMDLLFLFWSIGIGIVCGAGTYELAVIISLFVTVGLVIFQLVPMNKSPYLLVINADERGVEEQILGIIKKYSPHYRIDSKNLSQSGMDMIVEIRSKYGNTLVDEIKNIHGVRFVSFLYHEGNEGII